MVLRLNYIRPGNDIRKRRARGALKGRTTWAKNKAAHYTQAVHDEYSLRSNENRCSNASCRKIAALKREKCRPTEKTRAQKKKGTRRDLSNSDEFLTIFFFFNELHVALWYDTHQNVCARYVHGIFFLSFFWWIVENNVAPCPTKQRCVETAFQINWNAHGNAKWRVNSRSENGDSKESFGAVPGFN